MDLRLLSFALGQTPPLLWPWLPSWEWGGLALLLLPPRRLSLLVAAVSAARHPLDAGEYAVPAAWLEQLGKTSHITTARAKYGVLRR